MSDTPTALDAAETDAAETAQEAADVPTYPAYYLKALGALFLLYFGGGFLLNLLGIDLFIFGGRLPIGYPLMAIGAAHFLTGLQVVRADEIGGITVLGTPTIQVTGTLVCTPVFLFELEKFTANTIEFELPADPQHIWREEVAPPLGSGMRPPIRITFAEEPNSDDPLKRRVTEEVVFFARIRIENFFNFWKRIGSLDEARHQLEDMGVALLSAELPRVTLSKAIEDIALYSGKLQRDLRNSTRSWGVRIVDARVKQFALAKNLNKAIQERASSMAKKQTTITDAEATKTATTLQGEGVANAIRAELDARTGGLKNMATTLGVDSEAILASEATRSIAAGPNNTVIVGTQGVTDLLGIVATAKNAFPKKGGDSNGGENT